MEGVLHQTEGIEGTTWTSQDVHFQPSRVLQSASSHWISLIINLSDPLSWIDGKKVKIRTQKEKVTLIHMKIKWWCLIGHVSLSNCFS
jgi:hypothetical protein